MDTTSSTTATNNNSKKKSLWNSLIGLKTRTQKRRDMKCSPNNVGSHRWLFSPMKRQQKKCKRNNANDSQTNQYHLFTRLKRKWRNIKKNLCIQEDIKSSKGLECWRRASAYLFIRYLYIKCKIRLLLGYLFYFITQYQIPLVSLAFRSGWSNILFSIHYDCEFIFMATELNTHNEKTI